MPDIIVNHKKINRRKLLFRRYGCLLISHHPECEEFKNHTLNIGSLRFCIGCFVGYPTAVIAIIIINLFKIQVFFDSITMLLLGLVFLSLFVLSPLNLTKRKGIKIFQKFCLGLGSAFLFWWIWSLSLGLIANLIIFIVIFSMIILILNGYHAYSFLKVCRMCKYETNWHNCPGFKSVYHKN